MHDHLSQALFMCVLVLAAVAARSMLSSQERTKQARMRDCPVETLQTAANRAVAASEKLGRLGPGWAGHGGFGLRRRAAAEWLESGIPLNRPEGNWVAWTFRGGTAIVKDTRQCAGEIDAFMRALAGPFDPLNDLIEIELQREKERPHGRGIISVGATVISGGRASHYTLGRLDRVATTWLARTYGSDMPIAAELVRLASDGKRYAIELACFMPSREERSQYKL
ncbi:hypothetical protein [Mangrovicoccus sp. HB161399]|uniref:hypothetical protein n=1 Tax=Mangrovicoccus sp. HB161399 TaxID=2720392 RepID=UPI0015546515|nr:hypothetical protein [Mangrovicoccus sp. HB161399]